MNWICFADRWPTVEEVQTKVVVADCSGFMNILNLYGKEIGYDECESYGACGFNSLKWCRFNPSKSFWIALDKPEIK